MTNGFVFGAGLVGMFVPLQEYVNGGVPPFTLAVQVTFCPIRVVDGDGEHVIASGFPEMTRLKVVCLLRGEPVTVMG